MDNQDENSPFNIFPMEESDSESETLPCSSTMSPMTDLESAVASGSVKRLSPMTAVPALKLNTIQIPPNCQLKRVVLAKVDSNLMQQTQLKAKPTHEDQAMPLQRRLVRLKSDTSLMLPTVSSVPSQQTAFLLKADPNQANSQQRRVVLVKSNTNSMQPPTVAAPALNQTMTPQRRLVRFNSDTHLMPHNQLMMQPTVSGQQRGAQTAKPTFAIPQLPRKKNFIFTPMNLVHQTTPGAPNQPPQESLLRNVSYPKPYPKPKVPKPTCPIHSKVWSNVMLTAKPAMAQKSLIDQIQDISNGISPATAQLARCEALERIVELL